MKILIIRAVATAILLTPTSGAAHVRQCKTLDCIRDEVTKIANRSAARQDFVGLSAVVVDRDKGSFNSHFGYQDLAKKTPTSKQTLYEMGSITKPFTFLSLALQDKVKLDDPISKYLPKGIRAPKPAGKDILMKHLISHTSEINRVPCIIKKEKPDEWVCFWEPIDQEDPYKNLSEENFYKFIDASAQMYIDLPDFFHVAPGYNEEYSNMGAVLAGELVAKAHGMSYDKLIQSKILDPLKMTQSLLTKPTASDKAFSNLAKVYTKAKHTDSWRQTKVWSFPAAKGAGALVSTAEDMEKFLRANLSPDNTPIAKGLKKGQSMLADVTATSNSNICKAGNNPLEHRCNPRPKDLYWAWQKNSTAPFLWHNGGTGGSRSMMAFTQDGSFGMVLMQNSYIEGNHYLEHLSECIMYIAGKRSNPSICDRFDG